MKPEGNFFELEFLEDDETAPDDPDAKAWNMDIKWELQAPSWNDLSDPEREYFSAKQVCGSIRVRDLGCESYNLLVVSGPARGSVWLDARVDGDGLRPVQMSDSTTRELDYLVWMLNVLAGGEWHQRVLSVVRRRGHDRRPMTAVCGLCSRLRRCRFACVCQ